MYLPAVASPFTALRLPSATDTMNWPVTRKQPVAVSAARATLGIRSRRRFMARRSLGKAQEVVGDSERHVAVLARGVIDRDGVQLAAQRDPELGHRGELHAEAEVVADVAFIGEPRLLQRVVADADVREEAEPGAGAADARVQAVPGQLAAIARVRHASERLRLVAELRTREERLHAEQRHHVHRQTKSELRSLVAVVLDDGDAQPP